MTNPQPFFDSARQHVEMGGSVEAALGMTDLDIINTLASNRQIITELRRHRDQLEATLERIRALADAAEQAPLQRLAFMFNGKPFPATVSTDELREALDGARG